MTLCGRFVRGFAIAFAFLRIILFPGLVDASNQGYLGLNRKKKGYLGLPKLYVRHHQAACRKRGSWGRWWVGTILLLSKIQIHFSLKE
jgi:hypothetical protein